ncbi:hypothetical protein N665_0105s0020 [Sinapis alba]|nr:hypothetical protein N665_0105s0020 [Sinapis alba]
MPTQWKMEDRITANDLGNGKFLFNFSSEEDIQKFLRQGIFHYNFCMFVLVRWEPIVHDDFPWIIPFWVEITGIPLHLWIVKNLKNIGGKLGHVDTMELSAGRLIIDVDTRKPLVFTKKEPYCSKKTEETRAQSGGHVDHNARGGNQSQQSFLSDHNDRDDKRYHEYNSRKNRDDNWRAGRDVYSSKAPTTNHWRSGRDVPPFKAPHTDLWRSGRDEGHDVSYWDKAERRFGNRRGITRTSAARYGSHYAPYEQRKPNHWREKQKKTEDTDRLNPNKLQSFAETSINDYLTEKERSSDKDNASRGSAKKLAGTIVTPSCIFQSEEYVTVHDQGNLRAISFSPTEKDGHKYPHEEEQMIVALQDMDIVGSSSMVNFLVIIKDNQLQLSRDWE